MISTDSQEIRDALTLMEAGCRSGEQAAQQRAALEYARAMYAKDWPAYVTSMKRIGFVGAPAVLDVGCGAGHWSLALAQLNHQVVGIDVNEEYCWIARTVASNFENGHRTLFAKGTAEEIGYPDAYFDLLVCHSVLMFCEHDRSLSEFNRVLTPGGRAYLGCSGPGWYLSYLLVDGIIGGDASRLANGFTVLSDSFKWQAGFRQPERLWLTLSADEMSALAASCGFREVARPGVHDGMADCLGVPAAWDVIVTKVSDRRQLADDIELLIDKGAATIAHEVRHQTAVGNTQLALLILDVAAEMGVAVDDESLLRPRALLRAGQADQAGMLLAECDDHTPEAAYARAIHAHAVHNYRDAVTYYRQSQGACDEATIGYLIAECYREQGRFDNAVGLYRELVERVPVGLAPWVGLLGCTAGLGQTEQARRLAAEFIQARYDHLPDKTEADKLLDKLSRGRVSSAAASTAPPSSPSADPLADKKVLLAPFEIAGNIERITRYLRREKVKATSANYYDSWLKYRCDVNLNVSSMTPDERSRTIDKFAREAIDKYDIFHFHFAHSLYPDLHDLPELRDKGKPIVFSFWGSDRRGPEWILYQQARFLGHRPPRPYFLNRELYRAHKLINQYADVMLGATCIPRGNWIQGHADTAAWRLEDKQRILDKNLIQKDPARTYFVHAPSNQFKKGSPMIMQLLKECKDEGMPIEVIFVNQVSPDKARELYAYADYAIDQVGVGTFGLFGVEMMCWEIPVLVYQCDLLERLRNYPPVVKITRENFKQQIERCVAMNSSGGRAEIGRQGRRWAIENEDITLALPEYLSIYRDLASGRQIPQLVNRSWYDEEARMQAGVKSEFYRYMTEHRLFDAIGISPPDYDRTLYY